jgi:hypothetical protein
VVLNVVYRLFALLRYCNPVYCSASGGTMDYEEHRKNQRAAFDSIDCMTKKPTHQARTSGVDMVRDMG